jgi:outer membrane protein assembly factor BamD
MRFLTILAAVFALAVSGCATLDETAGWSAEQFYKEAKSNLDSGNYQEALRLYGQLEARYPYGPYAQQAQLETAYAHYKNDEPAAAIGAADRFIKLHPRHPNVDYAYYLRGLASFKQGKSFLEALAPQDPAARDPRAARDSFNYFRELVQQFPDSKYADDAVKRMVYLRNQLARHELLVADYYLRRGADLAAAKRAKYVVENYPKTTSVTPALEVLVKAYRAMGMKDLADDAQRVLERNRGDSTQGAGPELTVPVQ